MKTKSHYELAGYLIQQYPEVFNGGTGFALKLGSILPDLCFYTHIQSHRYKGSFSILEKKLNRISNRQGLSAMNLVRLGVQLHYLADYFTFPHNEMFDGTMRDHRRYEKLLCQGLKHIFHSSEMCYTPHAPHPDSAEELMKLIRETHENYSQECHMLETDCEYIINVCAVFFRVIYESLDAESSKSGMRFQTAE